MAWKKGQSGNPSGRPKTDPELEALLKTYCADAISTLYKIATNPKSQDRARVMAANSILDRGLGKPIQRIAGKDGAPVVVHVLTLADSSWDAEEPGGDAT